MLQRGMQGRSACSYQPAETWIGHPDNEVTGAGVVPTLIVTCRPRHHAPCGDLVTTTGYAAACPWRAPIRATAKGNPFQYLFFVNLVDERTNDFGAFVWLGGGDVIGIIVKRHEPGSRDHRLPFAHRIDGSQLAAGGRDDQ